MFQLCEQGKLTEVRDQVCQLSQKKSAGRAKATLVKTPADDDDESDDEEVCILILIHIQWLYECE